MKRSGFKTPAFAEAKASYKPMARSPIKRGTKQMKRSRMKRHRVTPEETRWRNEVLRNSGLQCQWVDQQTGIRCQVRGKENLEAHHIAKRSQRPDLKRSPENGAALCRRHHSFSDTVDGQKQAKAQGLLGGTSYELAAKKPPYNRLTILP
jgi:hypothetical protein